MWCIGFYIALHKERMRVFMNHKVKLKGVLNLLLRWPVVLSVLFAAMDVQLFLCNIKA